MIRQTSHFVSNRRAAGIASVASLGLILGFATPALADSDLSGSWRGGGSVAFSSGAKERARCRASFSKLNKWIYRMNATCATASAKVAQTAELRRTGKNRYSGNFHNYQFGVSGTIHIQVSGRKQSVRLKSEAGSASLRLSKL